jgi:cyclopropane fatty-acyl-phospholipid synthase-like methyltransferase
MSYVPQFYDDQSRLERARARAKEIDKLIGLRGMKVLEVGTGHGDLAYILAAEYDCDVVATEVIAQNSWDGIKHGNLKLMQLDISDGNLASTIPDNNFDRIISFVVWEHMRHPYAALRECQRILNHNGKKYLHAYLGGAPRLSHLHYICPEPWIHLTHSETELKNRISKEELPWYFYCNRLTHSHYLTYFRKLGFYVTYENIIREPFNSEYYIDNEQILGLYPLYDLKTHGLQVVLEFDKANPKEEIIDPVYKFSNYRSG